MLPAEIILMAIEAGLKLYGGFREAYAASIKQAAITLPLPPAPDDFGIGIYVSRIRVQAISQAFVPADPATRSAYAAQLEQVKVLCASFEAQGQLAPTEENLVRFFFARWLSPPAAPADPATASTEATTALLSVRQWLNTQSGGTASAFQIAVGSVIDAAIGWFAKDPGAISTSRPEGRALRGFLEAINAADIDFAHAPTASLTAGVMVALLDTVAAQPRLVAGGKQEEALVKAAATAVAKAVNQIPPATLAGLSTDDSAHVLNVVQAVVAATLRAGGQTVLAHPALFHIGADTGRQAKVVEQVGRSFLDLVLPEAVGGQASIKLGAVVTPAGLETMLRAALSAVGENPTILPLNDTAHNRLQPLLADLATSLSRSPLPAAQSALADVAAIVLDATARHLDTLWPDSSLSAADNVARGAAIAAIQAISSDIAGTGYSGFRTADIVALAGVAVAAVVDNPALMKPGDTKLAVALAAMVSALKAQSVARLSGADVVAVVVAGLAAAARNLAMLQPVSQGAPMLLGAMLAAVFDALGAIQASGNAAAIWRVVSRAALLDTIRTTLEAGAALPVNNPVTSQKLAQLRDVLVRFFAAGRPSSELPGALAQMLAAQPAK
jgi:hypothetical protein